jgi:K(+)-stimulated pyrophosphate-energized sodium pump
MYGLNLFEQIAIWSVLGVAICGLLYALFLRHQILKEDSGTKRCRKSGGQSGREQTPTFADS